MALKIPFNALDAPLNWPIHKKLKKIPVPPFSQKSITHFDPGIEDDTLLADRIAVHMRTPKQVKTMDRRALVAMEAALYLDPSFPCPPERRGIVLTQPHLDGAYPALTEAFWARDKDGGDLRVVTRRFPPLWLTWHLPNMAAAHLASQFDCRGPVHSLHSGWKETSESREVVHACLDSGEADAVLRVDIQVDNETEATDVIRLIAHAHLTLHPDLT